MFNNAAHALEWSYNTLACPIIEISAINDMRQGRAICGDNFLLMNLTAQEAHGQASQIVGMVDRLPDPAGREYIAARFGGRTERSEIRLIVYAGCDSLGLGLEKQETVYRIIKAYFRGSLPVRMIMRELQCRHQAAIMTKSCLYDMLDVIHDAAMAEITETLERKGLVSSYYAEPVAG